MTNQSDNTSGLKLEIISPDRQNRHHFLADLKAALPNTQASPTLLKLFMLEAETLLHKMPTPGGGLHADARLSLTCLKNDGFLFADQVVQSMRLNFSERSRVCDEDRLAPVQLHGGGVVRRRSLEFVPVIHS